MSDGAEPTADRNDAVPLRHRFAGAHGLMVALDVNTVADAKRLTKALAGHIDAIKIGWQLILRAGVGLDVLSSIRDDFDGPILVDTKIQDVSHIAIETIGACVERADVAVTTWASIGATVLADCRAAYPSVEIFVMTGLTSDNHIDAGASVSEGISIARQSRNLHVQVPGNYPDLVEAARAELGTAACIVCCGMGAQGGEIGEAVAAGADFEIVGRDIYQSVDPVQVATRYRQRIQAARLTADSQRKHSL